MHSTEPGEFMRISRMLFLATVAAVGWAQTPVWDTAGNKMLNGTYYFRDVTYVLSNTGDGSLYDALAVYGTATFDGAGKYTMAVSLLDGRAGNIQRGNLSGTYAIAASGQGYLSNPLSTGDFIYGSVSAQGIFAGSSTENQNGFNDLLIAAPLGSALPTASTFKGTYSLAYMDLSSGSPLYTIGGMMQMTPDGAGNVGATTMTAYQGQSGSGKANVSFSSVRYIFSNGAAVVTFPTSNTALLSGQYYLYFSPDGNFVFGGSPNAFDMFVGVRTGTATPSLGGLFFEAGLDQDESNLSNGYADLDSYYGSISANAGNITGHQRLQNVFNSNASSFTYNDVYTVPANGAYATADASFVVGPGIRIGSGIGPYLGIRVALQAPSVDPAAVARTAFPQSAGNRECGKFRAVHGRHRTRGTAHTVWLEYGLRYRSGLYRAVPYYAGQDTGVDQRHSGAHLLRDQGSSPPSCPTASPGSCERAGNQ